MELLSRPVARWFLRYWVYSRPERVTEETVSDWWSPVPVPGTRRAALIAIRPSAEGLGDITKRITAPTLVLWGKEDVMLRSAEHLRLSEEIPGARLVVLPGTAHVPQEQTPKEFSRAVAGFLGGLRP